MDNMLDDGDQLAIPDLPENLDKGKGKALAEAFETYLRSRISQFWPILPFLYRIVSDFDTSKKTFYKLPCITKLKSLKNFVSFTLTRLSFCSVRSNWH